MNEKKRKILHLSALSILFAYWIIKIYFGKGYGIVFLIGILLAVWLYEAFRLIPLLRKKRKELNIPLPFQDTIRDYEKNRLTGASYLILGIIICFLFFDFRIAFVSVCMGILGDIIAGLVNGKYKIPYIEKDRYLESIIAEFLIDSLIGFIFLPFNGIIFLMAFTATIMETISMKLDDNLTVPNYYWISRSIFHLTPPKFFFEKLRRGRSYCLKKRKKSLYVDNKMYLFYIALLFCKYGSPYSKEI